MKLPFDKPGISCFLFVALLLVFNWPLLSIPAPAHLLGWLFTAWALAIALLFLAARRARGKDAGPAQAAEPAGLERDPDGAGGQGAGPDSGQDANSSPAQNGGGRGV